MKPFFRFCVNYLFCFVHRCEKVNLSEILQFFAETRFFSAFVPSPPFAQVIRVACLAAAINQRQRLRQKINPANFKNDKKVARHEAGERDPHCFFVLVKAVFHLRVIGNSHCYTNYFELFMPGNMQQYQFVLADAPTRHARK